MNEQLKQWTVQIQDKFGLTGYTCIETSTAYERNDRGGTSYRFTTEWLPPGTAAREESDLNPQGTAVVELDAQTGQLNSVIFVGGQAPGRGLSFLTGDKKEVVQFVEQETGWAYGQEFIDAERTENHDFSFQTAYKGIPVLPEGFVHVSLDEQKKLVFFSRNGFVPAEAEETAFQLTAKSVEAVAEKKLVFVEFPSEEEGKWLPLFMMDDVLIDNETGEPAQSNEEILTWKTAKNKKVKRKLVQTAPSEIKEEELFLFPPHPDTRPVTKKGYAKLKEASTAFLQTYVPKESGEWALLNAHRANGFIHVRLGNIKDVSVIPRMWKLIIDPASYEVISYVDDSSWMNDMYADYEKAPKPVVSKQEAFEKIKPFITVTPVYVFDGTAYRLKGKLDAHKSVHGVTGELLAF